MAKEGGLWNKLAKLCEVTVKCPSCGNDTLKLVDYLYEMPLVGKVILTTGKCTKCGYKFNDVRLAEPRGPRRIKVHVEGQNDLNIIVVRCSTASVKIPELGLELIPGPASEGFITTIEGLLHRFEEVLNLACEEEREECANKRREIREAIEGKRPFTLVVEDSEGCSTILSDKAIEERITG